MGLDTSHDCWHGPYSSFKRFREEVAAAAKEHYGYEPNYEGHPFRAYMGWWDHDFHGHPGSRGADYHEYDHILDVFFIHSDCDGYIFPNDAEPLADALDALVGYLDDDPNNHRFWSARETLRTFIKGLREAVNNYEVVTFH